MLSSRHRIAVVVLALFLIALLQVPATGPPAPAEQPITVEETVIVTATRTDRRIEDEPLRVEVVPEEEVQEKIMMTPGDVSMLLNETNGLRVQTTSPSLGGANVRIQGLRGRYTQILADGLPLYGGQAGSIGILQIPPMDLGQVEVIKGVASALYGVSAIGGVVNLVSRRPSADTRELLVNQTSHAGTDAVVWIAEPINPRWGYTLLSGAHWQNRSDLDEDGWTDLPMYRRFVVRPRLFWENGAGASVLVASGVTTERRRGGTRPGATTPEGDNFAENLGTTRADGGLVVRSLVAGGRLLAVRGSVTSVNHEHTFGPVVEDDSHRTFFGETSLTGTGGAHTWVAGVAWQRDSYQSRDVPRFDYAYSVPGIFAQDDTSFSPQVTMSASARLDQHSDHGTFFSPRLSMLIRPDAFWTVRLSAGRGYFAPSPFTEETEATGLRPLAPLGALEAERADSLSGDLTWRGRGFEITGTLFYSRIRDALTAVETGRDDFPIALANAAGPTETRGTEFIARYHAGELDVILSHMYLWSTEPDPEDGGRREVALNPRHSAGLDILWEVGPARTGIELFYTGSQALEDNPFRDRGAPYLLWGALLDWALTDRLRAFVNAENLGDVRQTTTEPLIRRARDAAGRWTIDAWAPLEGRTVNAGLRVKF
jgi:outer membrane receptor for ferrienterochelin and colicins